MNDIVIRMQSLTPILLFLSLISIMFNIVVVAWIERARRRENKELAILFTRLASNLNKFIRKDDEETDYDNAYPTPSVVRPFAPELDPECQP